MPTMYEEENEKKIKLALVEELLDERDDVIALLSKAEEQAEGKTRQQLCHAIQTQVTKYNKDKERIVNLKPLGA
jgi:hypothetical protein